MDTLKQTLRDLGLTEKEVDVYLTLQTTGLSPASVLGQRAGITRSTAQYVCQQLAKRGIVGTTHKGNTFLYAAEPPEKLLLLLQKERQALDDKESMVNGIIGTLRQMQHPNAARPNVRFYDGIDGLRAVYDEILKEASETDLIRSYVHPLNYDEDMLNLAPILQSFSKRRITRKIYRHIIATDTPRAREIAKADKSSHHETRFLPGSGEKGSASEVMMLRDRMYSISYTPTSVFAFIVQSEILMSLQREAFDALWDKLGSVRGKR